LIFYFFKTILLLGIFYALYALLLKGEKTYRWNRIYLIITSFLAIVLPLISLPETFILRALQLNIHFVHALQKLVNYSQALQQKEFDFAKIILGIYTVGLLWGLLRMALGFVIIYRVKEHAKKETSAEGNVYYSQSIESPFSFFKSIFIPENCRKKEILPAIIRHELAHGQLRHSRDKIYFSVLQAICWMNPFVYFYHKEIELVHEFEADAFTTEQIANEDYIHNLLQVVSYAQTPTLLVHPFFNHSIKTRIAMLYKTTKNAFVQKTTVVITGIIISLTLLCMQSVAQTNSKSINEMKKNPNDTVAVEMPNGNLDTRVAKHDGDIIYKYVESMPEFKGGETALMKYLSDHIQYPISAGNNNIQGRVILSFTVKSDGEIADIIVVRTPDKGEELAKEAIRVVSKMPKWKPGQQNGKSVNVNFTLPITFKLNK